MKTNSWHIPRISTYRIDPPDLLLHVVFLQRQSESSRTQIIERLGTVDKEWATQYDANPRVRRLKAVPWIRDHWPSSEIILGITSSAPDYKSFVLVDSGWEDGTVLAAHWADDEHGQPHMYTARVQMDVANVLLTLLDDGKVATFAEVLGEQAYEDAKVDFYKSPTGTKRKHRPYEPPSFLPNDLTLNKYEIEIIALRDLTDEQIKTLTDTIKGGTKRSTSVAANAENVKMHKWQGGNPSRRDLRQIYDWMVENSPEEDRHLPAFFVDNFLECKGHAPRVIAVKADGTPRRDDIEIFPLRTKMVLPYFEKNEEDDDHGMIWQQEILLPAEDIMIFSDDQERVIRAALNKKCDIEQGADWGSKFTYHGFIFPSDTGKTHSFQDLVDLFQKSDIASPSYDASVADLHFDGYPHHFVALDERVLDPDKPIVIMASSLDFSNTPTSSDCLGWLHGTIKADDAHVNFVNLDIANIGPSEILDNCEPLWLNDLSAEKKEADEREQAQ
nr:hypothetical protein CFP56_37090 [Quercus suber]